MQSEGAVERRAAPRQSGSPKMLIAIDLVVVVA